MSYPPRYIGILLAAGRGSRMGGTKQLTAITTPAGTKPLLAAAYDAIRPICDDIIVVLGHEADAVAASLEGRLFHRATSNPDAPMYESIRTGLRAAAAMDDSATVVVQPGDQPNVARVTLDALVDASRREFKKAVIPQFGTKGGHPVLIPPPVASLLIDTDCPAGLGEFWTHHPDLCIRVPVNDASVLQDIDTPADLP